MVKTPGKTPIQYAKGVGPQRARIFSRLGITSIDDALHYLPFRYEDRSSLKKISEIQPGAIYTIAGKIVFANIVRLRGRKFSIFEAVISDETGLLKAKWFNQPFLQKNFTVGRDVIFSGNIKENPEGSPRIEMDNPEYEVVADSDEAFIHTKRIVPFYRITEGISQKQFRKIMFDLVLSNAEKIIDGLPLDIAEKYNLPPLAETLAELHFPKNRKVLHLLNNGASNYHRRLSFDELFMFELGVALLKRNTKESRGIAFNPQGRLRKELFASLPFELTQAQKRVISEIRNDMKLPYPMHRLLQGDVGCGKTVIALSAMLDAVECGYQTALMAPTEILAEQHYINIHRIAEKLGLKTALVTGGSKNRQEQAISLGEIDLVIGTHALIQEGIRFKALGLAVIDEQHKFGVMQRAVLRKKGLSPDVLVMTATPIPRSLALTLYGDLECSVIDELPSGRKPVITKLVDSAEREQIYALMRKEIQKGRQVYVVYPAIEESEKMELKSAVQGKEAFEQVFPDLRISLLHGRMGADEREKVMSGFRKKEADILVSTTVIEVGLDLPDATVMLIIHAERFGLSQLHQLRGRVGRGSDRSYCLLIAYKPFGPEAKRRLDIMVKSNDGFRIAEEDLDIRGPGEFLGVRQAGLPDLRHANIARDISLLESAREEAFSIIEESPLLEKFPSLKKGLDVFWKGRVDLFKTG